MRDGNVEEGRVALFQANKMLSCLFKSAGVARNQENVIMHASFRSLQRKVKAVDDTTAENGTVPMLSPRGKQLSTEELATVFRGEYPLLMTAMKVLAQLAGTLVGSLPVTAANDEAAASVFVDRLYSECVLYVTLILSDDSGLFTFPDFNAISSLVTKVYTSYATGKLPDSGFVKQAQMVTLLKSIALKSEEPVHAVVSMAHDIMLTIVSSNETDKCTGLVEKLLELYDCKTHSRNLVSYYGVDMVPRTLSLALQQLHLVGATDKYQKLSQTLLALLMDHTHLHSIALGAIGYVAFLVATGQLEQADALYQHFKAAESKDLSSSQFKILSRIIGASIEQAKGLARYEVSKSLEGWSVASDEITKFVEGKALVAEMDSKLSELYSIGLQGICGHYCYAEGVSRQARGDSAAAKLWLNNAAHFLEAAITINQRSKLTAVGTLCCLQFKVLTMTKLQELASDAPAKEAIVKVSAETAAQLNTFIASNGYRAK